MSALFDAGVAAWLIATIAPLVVVALVARKIEFNGEFRARLYRLSPDDLKDSAYAETLHGVLDFRAVNAARRWYIAISVGVVAVSAWLVACSPLSVPAHQLFPPLIIRAIEPPLARQSCAELIFLWAWLF